MESLLNAVSLTCQVEQNITVQRPNIFTTICFITLECIFGLMRSILLLNANVLQIITVSIFSMNVQRSTTERISCQIELAVRSIVFVRQWRKSGTRSVIYAANVEPGRAAAACFSVSLYLSRVWLSASRNKQLRRTGPDSALAAFITDQVEKITDQVEKSKCRFCAIGRQAPQIY